MSNLPPLNQVKAAQDSAKPVDVKPVVPTGTLDPNIAKLLLDVMELKAKVDAKDKQGAASAAQSVPKEIDWTKITEKDIVNLDLNIPVIEQERPNYMDVHLTDKNYISRWINKMPERLGICLSSGYSYVTEADLDKNWDHPLQFDTNGHYAHGDVVCLRILKSRYFPAIKANYMKTMAIHGKGRLNNAIKTGKTTIHLDRKGEEIKTSENLEPFDPRGLEVYYPGDEATKGEVSYTKDQITL